MLYNTTGQVMQIQLNVSSSYYKQAVGSKYTTKITDNGC